MRAKGSDVSPLIPDLFFVSIQMDSSQLHILFLITLELTFCRLLIKERAKQELATSVWKLEIELYHALSNQAWQSPHGSQEKDLGAVKAKIVWRHSLFLPVIQISSQLHKYQLLPKARPSNMGIRYKKGKLIFLKTLSQDVYYMKPVVY